jgi:hypothetical protein
MAIMDEATPIAAIAAVIVVAVTTTAIKAIPEAEEATEEAEAATKPEFRPTILAHYLAMPTTHGATVT